MVFLRLKGADEDAVQIWKRIIRRVPSAGVGERASVALGDYYLAEREYAEAEKVYEAYLALHPQGQMVKGVSGNLKLAKAAIYRGDA